MAETKRRPPAIFDRALGEWHPQPQYIPFPEFTQPANPVLPPQTRILSELDVVPLPEGSGSRYQRFPYLDASLFPASPVLPFRYGQTVLQRPEAFVAPRFSPFPYFQEPPAAARPVIPPRIGQDILPRDQATPWVDPRFGPFPYFEQPAEANPVIGVRMGRDVTQRDEAAFVAARFLPFPYFEQPANPVIPPRMGRDVLQRDAAAPWAHPRFERFPYFEQPAPAPASPAIGFRYGRIEILPLGALIAPQHLPYPYAPRVVIGKGRARIRFIDRAVLVRDVTFQVPDPVVTAAGLTSVPATVVAPILPGAFTPQIVFEPFKPVHPPGQVVIQDMTFQVPNTPVGLTTEEVELLLLDFWRNRADD